MQKIDNIEIKNFKSIRHQKIEGCKRINVFIGYPNVGKSNIIEALSLFSVTNENSSIKDLFRLDSNPNLFFNGNIETALSIKINGIVEITGRFLNDGNISMACKEVDQSGMAGSLIYSFSVSKDFSISGPVSKLGYESSKETLLVNAIKRYSFKKEAFAESSDTSLELNSPFGTNLYSFIHYNNELKNEVRELLKEYSLSLIFDQGAQMMKVVKQISVETAFIISFNLLADTLLRLIFYKAAILSNKNSVLLFEEPESQMFPPYIAKLTSDIIFDENNNQYFIATHSPYVLNEFIEEAQEELAIYLVDYDKGQTVIKRLKDEQISEIAQYGIDLFFNLEPYLDKYGQPSGS